MSESEELLRRIDRHIDQALSVYLHSLTPAEFDAWVLAMRPDSNDPPPLHPPCRCDPLIDDDPPTC